MLGYSRDELIGANVSLWNAQWSTQEIKLHVAGQLATDNHSSFETRHRRRDGSVMQVEISGQPLVLDGKRVLFNSSRNISQRKQAELAIARQKDLYDVLSQTNEQIVRGANREELLRSICRIAVEHAHFCLAWIGLIDEDDKRLKPVAQYGQGAEIVRQFEISVDETVFAGAGRTGQALRTGTSVVINDFDQDQARAWSNNREVARRSGARAYGSFPIRRGGVVAGAINFYAAEPGFFAPDLVATLEDMAKDVSFALDNFERDTERKRAEALLRDSEERLHAIFDGTLDGILVADAASRRMLTANAAVCRMLGYTSEEIVGIGVSDIHPKPDLPRVIREFEKLLRGETTVATNIPMLRKDGSTFHADIHAAPIRLDGKNCLLGMFRDTTERIQAERQLVESEARFRGLTELSSDWYWEQDRELRMRFLSSGFAERSGSTREKVLGRRRWEEPNRWPLQGTWDDHRAVLEAHEPFQDFEYVSTADDGKRTFVTRSGVPIFDVAGNFSGYRGVGTNITARKQAEEALRAAEVQFRSLVEQSIAGIYIVQDGKFAYVNGRCGKIFGYQTAAEMIDRDILSLVAEKDRNTVEVATTLSEMRDPYTAGHERRVAEIAAAIGAELGLDARQQEGLRVAGHLHDIGKISIPTEILAKPGRLSAIEFELIKTHPRGGYDVLKDVKFPSWPVAQVALQHHERLDGSGYPQRLKGEAIILEARIIAVADVVEAMSSHRPYRPGVGVEKALEEIRRGRGTLYDAATFDACLHLFQQKHFRLPT